MHDIYLDESIILLDLQEKTKEDVLSVMGGKLYEKGLVKATFIDAIIAREREFPTGLPTKGVSVAIPHTDIEQVNQKTIGVGVLSEPVAFGVMGGGPEETTPVQLVFMLAMDETHSQLALLQRLMQMFQDADILNYLCREKDKKNVRNLIESKLDVVFEGGE